MIAVSLAINGRKVRPNQIGDALERAMFEQVRDTLVHQLHGIRDPKTCAPLRIKVKGQNLRNLSIEVEGRRK